MAEKHWLSGILRGSNLSYFSPTSEQRISFNINKYTLKQMSDIEYPIAASLNNLDLISPTTSFIEVTPVSFFFCVKGRRDDCFAESFLPFL